MSIDLSQFHQVFFEESFEGLDIMESSLLALDLTEVDAETINSIFRAAHSIKGGAGTFGFMQVSGFTHVVETLLDEIRSGDRDIKQEHVDLFLICVDCLRGLLSDLQAHTEPDMAQADELKAKFEAILAGTEAETENSAETNAVGSASDTPDQTETAGQSADSDVKGWKIEFIPCEDVLCTGNEPYRMFRELQDLAEAESGGSMKVVPHLEKLPEFSEMHPEMCYLSWTIFVYADIELSDIEEIFEWVVDDCDIRYERLTDAGQASDQISEQISDQASDVVVDNNEVQAEDEPAEINAEPTEIEAEKEIVAETPAAPITPATETEQTAEVASEKTPTKAAAKSPTKAAENTSIRVSIDKIDGLINMVGELVITIIKD